MVSVSVSKKKFVSEKVSVSVSKIFGIEKSIGIGFGKNLVSKKVLDSVSLRFWVLSHTGIVLLILIVMMQGKG